MTTGQIGPGTLLAGRYRLDDLLAESEGARFWRATDTVLARSVAVHAVPSEDERAPRLMEAARVSATVTDAHLLRVLDCDDESGITWVVNEWGDGVSLDLMLQHGTLPPSRAAWLAREVAEAIAAGHAQGVAHGRLNPESVLVTHAGAVKLIGYVVDAALERPGPPDPLYGELDDRESDVINLAGILYAALTGRWPGVARSAVPRAPREARRPLRPRQVRAGVPRTLDAICERVLHKEASQHAMPIETAQEIAAALSDYVGDPGLSAPLDPSSMYDEPTISLRRDQLPSPAEDVAASAVAAAAAGASAPDGTPRDGAADPPPDADLEDTRAGLPAVDPGPGGEATQIYREPLESPDSLTPLRPPGGEEVPPPPPFEDSPERPLFASGERRVPPATAAAAAAAATAVPAHSARTGPPPPDPTAAGTGPGTVDPASPSFWPFGGDDPSSTDVHTGREGRGWLRTAVVVGVLLLLVVAMVVAFNLGRGDGGETPSSSDPTTSGSRAASAAVKIADVRDFDPFGDPAEENPEDAAKAIDGDPGTAWPTMTYRGNAALGGLKSGVGLMLDLGRDRRAGSVTVRFNGSPTSFEVYAAPQGVTAAPDSLDQLDKVGSRADAPERATVQLDGSPTTRYLVVWLTRLPASDGGFRGEVADVTVRS